MQQLQHMDLDSNSEGIRIIEELQADWKKLATSFDLPEAFINNHRREEDSDACRAVFNSWLNGEGDEGPRTWNTVIRAIKRAGRYRRLIGDIQHALERE